MAAPDQPQLPGWCWRCMCRRRVTVAVTISGEGGELDCRVWETACPDCAVSPTRRAWLGALRELLDQDRQQPADGR